MIIKWPLLKYVSVFSITIFAEMEKLRNDMRQKKRDDDVNANMSTYLVMKDAIIIMDSLISPKTYKKRTYMTLFLLKYDDKSFFVR